jgi:hypothetical protein
LIASGSFLASVAEHDRSFSEERSYRSLQTSGVLDLLGWLAVRCLLRGFCEEKNMPRRKRKAIIDLPDEFLELCDYDMIDPETVLRGFIADLCSLISWASEPRADRYSSNGSNERDIASAYYDRVGYPYSGKWRRENAADAKVSTAVNGRSA